ncbi:MAG: VWA domain-containing protein [bacterium]
MKRTITIVLLVMVIVIQAGTVFGGNETENLMQMAILLDTSNSMDGLIEQAKSQLWKIVNELAVAKKNGASPDLHVALYEYGNDSLPGREGYLRRIVPLTTDLDRISEELFKLTTNGGSEYCGQAIRSATSGLDWHASSSVYKVIFIAGNEPFSQGVVDYKGACKAAIEKGIIVNTIFCGDYHEGVRTDWKKGADLADGKYMNIDQNEQAVHIDAPQDEEIARLGKELNTTYIAYGAAGRESLERQAAQDENAARLGKGSLVQRSITKSKSQYTNEAWDLVDAERSGEVEIENMKKEDLPEEMRKMSAEERKHYLAETAKRREEIQKRINVLNEARRTYIEKEHKRMAEEHTLDMAVINAVREQAGRKQFDFE